MAKTSSMGKRPKGTRPTYTMPTVRRCLDAVSAGDPITHVAEREGIAFSTVHRWCRLNGVESHFPWPHNRHG